jgi:hypothetical protein
MTFITSCYDLCHKVKNYLNSITFRYLCYCKCTFQICKVHLPMILKAACIIDHNFLYYIFFVIIVHLTNCPLVFYIFFTAVKSMPHIEHLPALSVAEPELIGQLYRSIIFIFICSLGERFNTLRHAGHLPDLLTATS